jgi:ring-1,2-phenylacetyl-CoA epoxidase subunit PaaC
VSAKGRAEREHRSAQHEGVHIRAKGRPEREHRSAQHEGDLIRVSFDAALHEYLLRLADSPLVLAQRLTEWVGKGPAIEEDIALANVGLDLLGQARMWFAYAGEVEARIGGATAARDEDTLAFHRDAPAFRNLLLVEQPNGDYAQTIVRQFLFDHAQWLLLAQLSQSADARIGEIAAKALKEVTYHVERSDDWMIRLGDGTDESHARMQRALDTLWMYTGEMFIADDVDIALAEDGIGIDPRSLQEPWVAAIGAVLDDATLARPQDANVQRGGRQGRHSEHLGHLLCDMQFLQRAYPDARW